MKICSKCSITKLETEFNWKNKSKGIRQSACKLCTRRENATSYNKYNYRYPEKRLIRNAKIDTWFIEKKNTLQCSQCGENHPATLDFHHLDRSQKDFSISKMVSGAYSIARIEQEIAKCIILCANCHRKLHWNERNGI